MADLDLPASVLALIEFDPIEDFMLAVLRQQLPDVQCYSLIPEAPPAFFIAARRVPVLGDWEGDERFVDVASMSVECFAQDPDGDEKGAILSEAARVGLRNAWRANITIPNRGSLTRCTMRSEPTRKSDWATSTGPVQYADLPNAWIRYETTYDLIIRKPRTGSVTP